MLDDDFKKAGLDKKENKVKGLYTMIYNMNSTAHNNFKKSGLDKKEEKVEGLYTKYNMNSTAHMTDNNYKKSGPDKTGLMINGLKKEKLRLKVCILYII